MTQRPARQRVTWQRLAIGELLEQTGSFLSAQQLHDRLAAGARPISLATVYRTLQSLADEGALDVLRTDEGESLYRRCDVSGHHHHLVCRSCGRTEEVAAPAAEAWAANIAAIYGFTDVEHTLEVFGTCPACAARAVPDGGPEGQSHASQAAPGPGPLDASQPPPSADGARLGHETSAT